MTRKEQIKPGLFLSRDDEETRCTPDDLYWVLLLSECHHCRDGGTRASYPQRGTVGLLSFFNGAFMPLEYVVRVTRQRLRQSGEARAVRPDDIGVYSFWMSYSESLRWTSTFRHQYVCYQDPSHEGRTVLVLSDEDLAQAMEMTIDQINKEETEDD